MDVDLEQEDVLDKVVQAHPGLILAGTGKASPRRLLMGRHKISKITSETFP
ncbi:MAG: hypothetical protein ACI9KN_002486 [Gammaproteobacteria bacterium]|jgi:hypothetical protein